MRRLLPFVLPLCLIGCISYPIRALADASQLRHENTTIAIGAMQELVKKAVAEPEVKAALLERLAKANQNELALYLAMQSALELGAEAEALLRQAIEEVK